ncbi:MAG: 16S rRNA processing protein RimM [Candidatus Azotimanducaceae bacterium]|jgi:16S rRNA processing protein RimM
MTEQAEKILVGKINAVYGLKGWVKVYSYTDPKEQIFAYKPWMIKRGSTTQELKVDKGKVHGKGLVVLAEGYEDRTQAEALIGNEIWVDRMVVPELAEGDYYWEQLEGLNVINQSNELLGEVSHLLETGANDVLVVAATKDSIDDKERLIPYVESEVVLKIDLEANEILVAWQADF